MQNQIFKYIITVWTIFVMTFAMSSATPAYAQTIRNLNDCNNINLNEDSWNTGSVDKTYVTTNPLAIVCPVVRILNIMMIMGGVTLVVMILFAAYRFSTSTGDPKAIKGAQNTLTYSIMGFLIVIGVYTIMRILVAIFGLDPTSIVGAGPFNSLLEALNDLLCLPTGAIEGVGCQ